MAKTARELKSEINNLPRDSRNRRIYPERLKREIIRHVTDETENGTAVYKACKKIGLHAATYGSWVQNGLKPMRRSPQPKQPQTRVVRRETTARSEASRKDTPIPYTPAKDRPDPQPIANAIIKDSRLILSRDGLKIEGPIAKELFIQMVKNA